MQKDFGAKTSQILGKNLSTFGVSASIMTHYTLLIVFRDDRHRSYKGFQYRIIVMNYNNFLIV